MTSSHTISGAGGIPSTVSFGRPTVSAWFEETLAPFWIEEALRQTRDASEGQARRREVILAVAAAESYLVEWVRDDVFKRDLKACSAYFLAREQQPVLERWKDIQGELKAARLIPATQDLSSSQAWTSFRTLVATRNALVHGNYSRPRTTVSPPGKTRPLSPIELDESAPGWAVAIVCALVRELCAAAETSIPAWVARQGAA